MVSKLARTTIQTTKKSKRKGTISKITIHHMAGKTEAASSVATSHAMGSRKVSANYYIDNNGGIVAGAEEEYRAWTSSNSTNDDVAITIEVSNDCNKAPWSVSEKAYKALIELCTDICRRYNIIPHYDGTREASLTVHQMFAKTACPGPYIMERLQNGQIETDINAYLGLEKIPVTAEERKSPEEVAREVISGKWGSGEERKNRLTQAGYNYRQVQVIVNKLMKG